MPMPSKIPYSKRQKRHPKSVAKYGTKSNLLVCHIFPMIFKSMLKMTAPITIEAKLARGMNAQIGIKNVKADKTSVPVNRPPKGVLAPLATFTEVRPNEAETGMDPTNEPMMLHIPSAHSSRVASTGLPFAETRKINVVHVHHMVSPILNREFSRILDQSEGNVPRLACYFSDTKLKTP